MVNILRTIVILFGAVTLVLPTLSLAVQNNKTKQIFITQLDIQKNHGYQFDVSGMGHFVLKKVYPTKDKKKKCKVDLASLKTEIIVNRYLQEQITKSRNQSEQIKLAPKTIILHLKLHKQANGQMWCGGNSGVGCTLAIEAMLPE